jgi:hypothetical protein
VPISEPVTTITDYALAAVAGLLALRLARAAGPGGDRAPRLWAMAFAVTGLAALVGGSVHGFGPMLPPGLRHALWVGTVMGVGLASALLLAGTVFASVGPGPTRRALLALSALKLGAYLGLVAKSPDFRYAVYDSVPVVLLVLAALVLRWRSTGAVGAGLGAVGLLVSAAGAVLQQAKLGIHPVFFNHNDLYHAIQAGALWLLHRAGVELRDAR